MRRTAFWATVVWAVISGVAIQGCAPPERVVTYSHPALAGSRIDKVGLMPFFTGRHPSNVRETLNCNLCRLAFDPDNVAAGADSTLTRFAHEAMYQRYGERVIPLDRTLGAYANTPKDDDRDTPLSLTMRVGQAIGVNHMLLGTVWRYRDKTGSGSASNHPASVAFDLYLVEVRTGETLWMGNFDETQKALSENILDLNVFLRRGSKWLSANELGRYGVQEIVKQMPM
jgi:hypothetical protein